MTEIDLNRASHLIDPQLHIWGWEIAAYLFLGGLTAGVMILSALLQRRVPREAQSRWLRLSALAAPLLLSAGMLALFLDLDYPLHVYRFYAAFRWSSPMSWGSWILLGVYPASILLGLAGLTEREVEDVARSAPARALRAGGLLRRSVLWASRHATGLGWANVALGVALGGYTGILLGALGARAVWSSAVLGPLFLASGVSTGAALMMVFPISHEEHGLLRRWDLGAIGTELALLFLFLLGMATGPASSQNAVHLFLGGRFTAPFFALVVAAGLLVPLALEVLEGRRQLRPTLLAPLLLLLGGLSLRFILVAAGQAS